MAAKRSTNNSSVASLEEQTAVINGITGHSGLSVEVLGGVPIDKDKKKKAKLPKKKIAAAVSSQGSVVAPAELSITAPSSGGGRGLIQSPPSTASALLGTLPSDGRSTGSAGLLAVTIGGGAGTRTTPSFPAVSIGSRAETLVTPSTSAQSWAGLAEPSSLEAMQQQWLWQQQFQQMAFNPYGNFVPNFAFVADLQMPDWQEEGEEVNPEPEPERARQGDHEVSDDEEDDVQVIPAQVFPAQGPALALAGPCGKLEELAKDQMSRVKEADKVSPDTLEDVAALLDKLLVDCQATSEMERITKVFPRVNNVEYMKVPRLDEEVYQALEQNLKNVDQVFQGIQRAVLGAMSAFTPILALAWARKLGDPDLNELSPNLLEGFRLLAHAHNALSTRRREQLKPHLAPAYAKFMTKGSETSPDWLYGGELVETTKQCEAARKIGDKVLKRRLQPPARGRGANQKRFRAPFVFPHSQLMKPYPGQVQHLRYPYPVPQTFQPTPQFFQGASQWGGGFPRRFRAQGPRQPRQNFTKRAAYNK